MSAPEIARRMRDQAFKEGLRVTRHRLGAMVASSDTRFAGGPAPIEVDRSHLDLLDTGPLITTADRLLEGEWRIFGSVRTDMQPSPDWFLDNSSGLRAPADTYSFSINHRDASRVGNVKYVWEPSRHNHVTMLAAAYYVTQEPRYAEAAGRHLRSWWAANPALRGIHWTSGIELGIRLISWVWTRRLLDRWPGAASLFEDNEVFRTQVFAHQHVLASLPSHGSSANNHLIAEAAGLFVAACAAPFFRQSETWIERSASLLEREAVLQTFPSGINREMATEYHGLVLELFWTAAIEGELAGHPLHHGVWDGIVAMLDALAAMVDAAGHPPRQGDADDGIGLLVDDPQFDRWASLLGAGDSVFERRVWWPVTRGEDLRRLLWSSVEPGVRVERFRSEMRPSLFLDAGMAILRDQSSASEEIWCRCDAGPHGFLATAAHGHADALSVEVRYGGVEVLADPGTYCYHTDLEWRSYFRSTRGHNTLELTDVDQSVSAGPFNWTTHAQSRIEHVAGLEGGARAEIVASHDGYTRLEPAAVHRRRIELDRDRRLLVIEDRIESIGSHRCRLSFHLGPTVSCELRDGDAYLRWDGPLGVRTATLVLPNSLHWTLHRGEVSPPAGWYSPSFDVKVPTVTLFGIGTIGGGESLATTLTFDDAMNLEDSLDRSYGLA